MGRRRLVEPFAFRQWIPGVGAVPALISVPLVFHRRCWAEVRRIGDAAEHGADHDRPADPPLTYCDHCAADTYPATDHYCPVPPIE